MSDTEEEKQNYVPFGQRSEWDDVKPIPADEGPDPICSIAYTPQFSDTMDYFRAILQADERSIRSLNLLKEVIEINPANYTAWYFRRLVLETLQSDLYEELSYVSQIGMKNPKNYQIWFHRRHIIEKLNDFSKELEYTTDHLMDESKNYHAWAYRQWVVQTTNLWEEELDFIDKMLHEDMRNNSAWNQRFFVITQNRTKSISKDTQEREIQYAFEWIKKGPNNPSPWSYIKGLFINEKISDSVNLKNACIEFREKHIACSHVASLLVDIYESEQTKESIQKASGLCTELEISLDSLHKKYWVYRKQNLPQL